MVTAKGMLVHRFWGTYSAGIALEFASEAHARDALVTLGAPWKQGEKCREALVAFVESDALDDIKARFAAWGLTITPCGRKHCKHQCRDAPIDNVNHSIDRGANFSVSIPTIPAEQESLPHV